MTRSEARHAFGAMCVLQMVLLTGAPPGIAGPLDDAVEIDLPAQPLGNALRELAKASGLQLLFDPALVAGRSAPAVAGSMAPRQALERLVQGTGLEAHEERPGVLVIRTRSTPPPSSGLIDAAAQAAETAAAEPPAPLEIVVTAQRREQSLKDVPIAVSAFTAADLDARNITTIQDTIGELVPNVKIVETGRTTAATIAIRGGVTVNPALYWDQTVGIYMDGVYVGKNVGSVFSLPNLERIEILRGPQGTLYGRNTLSGAVNIVTRKPTGEPGGMIELGIGDYSLRTVRATVDLPSAGPLSIQLSGQLQERDGFVDIVDNPFPNVLNARPRTLDELDTLDNRTFRAAARWRASDALVLDYAFQYDEASQRPQFFHLSRVAEGGIFDPDSPAYIGGLDGDGQYHGFPLDLYVLPTRSDRGLNNGTIDDVPPNEDLEIFAHTLTARWEVGDVTFTSISGHRDLEWDFAQDLDTTPLSFAQIHQFNRYRSFSQELQAVGRAGPRLQYTAGVYYFSDDGSVVNPQQFFGTAVDIDARYAMETDSYAAYGQLEYTPPVLSDRLTLVAGLRYGREEKSGERSVRQVATDTYTIPPGTRGKATFSAATPLLTVRYAAGDDVSLYAKYARGYRSGGFNLEAPTAEEVVRPFDDETVDEFEIGAKTSWLDGRLVVNAAAFWDVRKDMQLSVFVPVAGGGALSVVRNAGKADIRGLELEVQATLLDRLRIRGSLGLMDAEYDEFIDLGVDVADDRAFPYTPDLTASLSADVLVARTALGDLRLLIDYSHSDSYYLYPYSFSVDPNAGQNARTSMTTGWDLVNARLQLLSAPVLGGSADISLWAKNVFDREYRVHNTDFGPAFGGMLITAYGAPRTIGASVAYRW